MQRIPSTPPLPGAWQRAARGAGLLAPDGTSAPTIFAEMSALAVQTGAINLGQGFPDEDGPVEVLDAAREAISTGRNQYPPGRGEPDLRQAVSEHQRRFYGLAVDPDREVLITAGATEALAATLLGLVDGPGDEVVVFEPTYDAYSALIALAGAIPVPVPLRPPLFQPDIEELRRAVTDRTRLILVNDPHNPTGATFDADVRDEIVRLAEKHDAIIVTDEVYEHLVFDSPHVPLATLEGARERTLSISSAGKTFSVTGWKVGWITGPAHLIDAVIAVKQWLTYVNGAPFQPAVAVGLRLPDEFFLGAAATLHDKHTLLATGLDAAGFSVIAPQAGYFTIADARELCEAHGRRDADDLCRWLPKAAGVVAIPVTAFVTAEHRDDYSRLVRFAACKRLDVITDASERLAAIARA